MGSASAFVPARLVIGVLSSPEDENIACRDAVRDAVRDALEARFGPADLLGPELSFSWSDYYDEEMGGRPRRSFISFPRLVEPSELAAIKTWTDSLELSFASGGNRRVNLDPGLLSLANFILATTKNRPHRIALALGIYAEVTLLYEDGDFRPLPWTYPDWASEEYRALLRELRARLKLELRRRG